MLLSLDLGHLNLLANPLIAREKTAAGIVDQFRLRPDLAGRLTSEAVERQPPATRWVWALSGGGAKGAFQLGAMLYLWRDVRYSPIGIASTSVGSVNALAVAEKSAAGFNKLKSTWLALKNLDDMYTVQPWVAEIDRLRLLRDSGISLGRMVRQAAPRTLHPDAEQVAQLDPLQGVRDILDSASGIAGFIASPIGVLIGATVTPLVAPLMPVWLPLAWSAASAIEEKIDDLRRTHTILSRRADGLFNFAPLTEKLRRLVDQRAIAAAGTKLRVCMVDLATQSLVYCDEHFELYRYFTDKATGRGTQENVGRLHEHWLGHAALASASIPVVNPPYPVHREHVDAVLHAVDGGVREIIPVGPARQILDETPPERPGERGGVIAIGAGVVNPSRSDFMFAELGEAGFRLQDYKPLTVGGGAISICIEEVADNELRYLRHWMAPEFDRMAIMPSFSLGETSSVDPGVVQLSIAYGWMTAFDQLAARHRRLTDEEYRRDLWFWTNLIIQKRYACWKLEREGHVFPREYPDLFEPVIEREVAPLVASGQSVLARQVRERLTSQLWGPVGNDWRFARNVKVGLRGFGTYAPDLADLIAAIRAHKRDIERYITQRVRDYGLDSLPSIHELSNFGAGNINSFADWSRHWERHVVTPDTMYPTGPGMIRQEGPLFYLEPFGRNSTPWNAQLRFTVPNQQPNDIANAKYNVDPETLTFDTSAAEARATAWFERSPDYVIVRHEGFVLPATAGGQPGTVPLLVHYKRDDDNWTTSRATVPTAGYARGVVIGHVFDPARSQPAGTIPLLSWFSRGRNDHLASADFTRFIEGNHLVAGGWRAVTPLDDYGFDRVEGFIYPPDAAPPAGAIPLYRWMSPQRKDSFTTAAPAWTPSIDGRRVTN